MLRPVSPHRLLQPILDPNCKFPGKPQNKSSHWKQGRSLHLRHVPLLIQSWSWPPFLQLGRSPSFHPVITPCHVSAEDRDFLENFNWYDRVIRPSIEGENSSTNATGSNVYTDNILAHPVAFPTAASDREAPANSICPTVTVTTDYWLWPLSRWRVVETPVKPWPWLWP